MADSALREKGREMRRKLLGDATVDRMDKAIYNDPIMAKFAEVTQETIFGALWSRPGLDLKTRALICVISDAATGRDPELKLHLRMARNQGWTEDELVEFSVAPRRLCRCAADPRISAGCQRDLRGDACGKMSADEAWRQTIAKAEVLLAEGEAAEDISGIADAVSGFNTALRMAPRADAPLDWAKTQSRLSAALRALGARIDDPVMLHSAMTACDHALEVYRPDTTPEDWARTVALLGAAQVVLGERDSDPAWLNAALNSYHLATRVYTRDAAPSDWARMQRNCGAVLSLQGERTGDTASLREAVDHYRAALGEYAEQDLPIDIAVTQSNLGQALRVLGERDNDRDTLAEAVAACRAALNVYTREATPLEWAMASTNLANALAALNDTASIEEAIAIYRDAITALDGPVRLQQRAIARYNLKRAEGRLAELRQSQNDHHR